MPAITALLHTHNDELRLGRALETLCPCDQILIVDHNSSDQTIRVAREYGAKIFPFDRSSPHSVPSVESGWILWLAPREALSEALAASIYELKLLPENSSPHPCSVRLRTETHQGWASQATPETRLIPHRRSCGDQMPQFDATAAVLEGELLRFSFP